MNQRFLILRIAPTKDNGKKIKSINRALAAEKNPNVTRFVKIPVQANDGHN